MHGFRRIKVTNGSREYSAPTFVVAMAAMSLIALRALPVTAQDCDAPRPNFQAIAPNASVPQNAAAFNGVWGGIWYFNYSNRSVGLCNKIYVTVTDAQHAKVFNCAGTGPNGSAPRCGRVDAQISGNELSFPRYDGQRYSFRLTAPGTLDGTYPPVAIRLPPTFAEFHKEQ